jgi:hypothetical protein
MYAIGSPSGHLMTLDAVLASKLVEALAIVSHIPPEARDEVVNRIADRSARQSGAFCSKLGAPIPPMPELGRERRLYKS